jgi:hypothetical protein
MQALNTPSRYDLFVVYCGKKSGDGGSKRQNMPLVLIKQRAEKGGWGLNSILSF